MKDLYSVYLMHKYVNKFKPKKVDLDINNFLYVQHMPVWTDRKLNMSMTIYNAIERFKKCSTDYEKILKADLKYPIICTYDPLDTYLVMDGYHRLGKAFLLKKKTIKAYVFTDPKLLKKFKLGPLHDDTYKKLDKMTQAQLDKLFDETFDARGQQS